MITPDIGRAARAIYLTAEYGGGSDLTQSSFDLRATRAYAIAVLRALAEPSDAAVEAGVRAATSAANLRFGIRAALRAARLAELGRSE